MRYNFSVTISADRTAHEHDPSGAQLQLPELDTRRYNSEQCADVLPILRLLQERIRAEEETERELETVGVCHYSKHYKM